MVIARLGRVKLPYIVKSVPSSSIHRFLPSRGKRSPQPQGFRHRFQQCRKSGCRVWCSGRFIVNNRHLLAITHAIANRADCSPLARRSRHGVVQEPLDDVEGVAHKRQHRRVQVVAVHRIKDTDAFHRGAVCLQTRSERLSFVAQRIILGGYYQRARQAPQIRR